jgi:hypothetical protein
LFLVNSRPEREPADGFRRPHEAGRTLILNTVCLCDRQHEHPPVGLTEPLVIFADAAGRFCKNV